MFSKKQNSQLLADGFYRVTRYRSAELQIVTTEHKYFVAFSVFFSYTCTRSISLRQEGQQAQLETRGLEEYMNNCVLNEAVVEFRWCTCSCGLKVNTRLFQIAIVIPSAQVSILAMAEFFRIHLDCCVRRWIKTSEITLRRLM